MIRPLHSSDIEAWSQLRVALYEGLHLEQAKQEALQVLQDPDQQAFAAFDQAGVMIGFVDASLRAYADGCDSSPVGYIEGWYVLPEHRRSNIGRRLVQAAEDWARARGCSEMASDVILGNTVSQQAHIRLGYEEVDRVVQYRKGL
jgi:aminoglycoside 6'-N-acetyltransferase I